MRHGRLAAGLARIAWNTGEGGGPIKIEFARALKKIYGSAGPAANRKEDEVIEVESGSVEEEKEMAGVGVSTN